MSNRNLQLEERLQILNDLIQRSIDALGATRQVAQGLSAPFQPYFAPQLGISGGFGHSSYPQLAPIAQGWVQNPQFAGQHFGAPQFVAVPQYLNAPQYLPVHQAGIQHSAQGQQLGFHPGLQQIGFQPGLQGVGYGQQIGFLPGGYAQQVGIQHSPYVHGQYGVPQQAVAWAPQHVPFVAQAQNGGLSPYAVQAISNHTVPVGGQVQI